MMSTQQQSRRSSPITVRTTVTNDHLHQLLHVAKEDPRLHDLHDIASIISFTGIRPGELRGLRWADIDFAERRFSVAVKFGGLRYVPLSTKGRQILEALRDRDPAGVFVLGKSPQQVLARVRAQLRAVAGKMGTGPVSLRSLRHSFFTHVMRCGANATTLMCIVGYRGYSPIKSFLTPAQICTRAADDLARLAQI